SLERLYENAIDWEHLPHLHRGSFAQIECATAGTWGFRARVWPQPYHEQRSLVLELRLECELRRWITTTLEGRGIGTEVWTHAFSLAEQRTLVVVDFFVPGIDAAHRREVNRFYSNLYARLYDEDVAMMTERQKQLDLSQTPPVRDIGRLMLG